MKVEKTEAAYHEVGHALFTLNAGYSVEYISVTYNLQERRWDGAMRRVLPSSGLPIAPSLMLPTETVITCAGFLTQAKYHATLCKSSQRVEFSTNLDFTALLQWMTDGRPDLQSAFGLPFKTEDSEEVVVNVEPRWFGGIDRTTLLKIQNSFVPIPRPFDDMLLDSLQQIMKKLDDHRCWQQIQIIANALISKGDQHAQLSQQDLLELIATHDLIC